MKPMNGEMTMNNRILPKPLQMMGVIPPALVSVAPTRPPTSACDEEDGIP